MKILHTADLHLGQILYQNYERSDEHRHFFEQVTKWCKDEKPDALLLSGDVFDIQMPSASTKKAFSDYFARLHQECPEICIVITAGNHDSPARIQADSPIWSCAEMHLIGVSPAIDASDEELEQYIVRLEQGYIVAMPFARGERREQLQKILDIIEAENSDRKPVVMMGHTAVTGSDVTGHSFEIGTIETQSTATFGTGYDYLALGHIHKPQTIEHPDDALCDDVTYQAPVARYSGSALHVSCDEKYPHTVSLVEIDKHGGDVHIRQLRIDELRHFYELPLDGSSFSSADDAYAGIRGFCDEHQSGYIRLRMDRRAQRPADFLQHIYDILAETNNEVRYNPKVIEIGDTNETSETNERQTFEVAELQQMDDPMVFIETTIDQYPQLKLDEVKELFKEVEAAVEQMKKEEAEKEAEAQKEKAEKQKEKAEKSKKKTNKENNNPDNEQA